MPLQFLLELLQVEHQLGAHQEAEPLKRHSSVTGQTPVFDHPSPQRHSAGNMALQRRAQNAGAAPDAVFQSGIQQMRTSPGQPLDPATRDFMGSRFRRDFSHVRVHTDQRAAESAQAINATAYTVGRDIMFGAGQYAPHSSEGRRLLAHELTHVVQQDRRNRVDPKNAPLQVDDAGERGAERAADRVMAGKTAGPIARSGKAAIQRQVFRPMPVPMPSPWPTSIPIPPVGPVVRPSVSPDPSTSPVPQPQPDDELHREPACGSKELPFTSISYASGPLGQGKLVKASPLTLCPPLEGPGSEPDRSIYKSQFDCINKKGQEGYWVRAHLLHGRTSTSGPFNLHGTGREMWNLIITDKSLNGSMSANAESPIINLVHRNRAVLWYESKVDSYMPGLDYFGKSITVDVGYYDPFSKNELFRVPGFPQTFSLDHDPPDCPAGPSKSGPVTGKSAVPGAGKTGAKVAGAPGNSLAFESTFNFCRGLKSRTFHVDAGDTVSVLINAEWVDHSGKNPLSLKDCPYPTYRVRLRAERYLRDSIVSTEDVPVGQPYQVSWHNLKEDDYLVHILQGENDREGFEASSAGCCMRGNLTVFTRQSPPDPSSLA